MKTNITIGWILLATGALVIVAMIISIPTLWFVVDIIVIIVCTGSGIFLLRSNTKVE
jgi:hypothetical protein